MYGNIKEVIADNILMPLGNLVLTTTYKDANLFHDFITKKAVTGIIHLLDQTLIDLFSKRQATVEIAIYRLEFVVARNILDQIIALRTDLRYFDIPIHNRLYLFGNNKNVITFSTIPHFSLTKRYNVLAYY